MKSYYHFDYITCIFRLWNFVIIIVCRLLYRYVLHKIFSRKVLKTASYVFICLCEMSFMIVTYIINICYSYNGRATAASPATGSKAAHNKELKNLLDEFCVL